MKLRDDILKLINNHKFTTFNKTCNDILTTSIHGETNIDIIKSLMIHYGSAKSATNSINWVLFTKPQINKKTELAKIVTFEVAKQILQIVKNNTRSRLEEVWTMMFENAIYGRELSPLCQYEFCGILNNLETDEIPLEMAIVELKLMADSDKFSNDERHIIQDSIFILNN